MDTMIRFYMEMHRGFWLSFMDWGRYPKPLPKPSHLSLVPKVTNDAS